MINRRSFLAAPLLLSQAARAFTLPKPKQILLIRHAEKTGDKADAHLNARGRERAAALPRLFPSRFETPQFIIATHASAHSNRPVETVTPLSHALHLPIDSRIDNEAYRTLARILLSDNRYSGATVLVCWHHGHIPALAAALGAPHPPAPWPDKQFDRVWKIGYQEGEAELTDLPQQLLPGDSEEIRK